MGIAVSGMIADTVLSYFKLIHFSNSFFIPFWLIMLWIWFSFTLPACYSWATKYPKLISLLGFALGPLTYWGGSKLSQVEILSPIYFSLFSSLFWGVLFFVIFNSPIKKLLFRL
jgi:hypothetical protein